MYFDGSKGGKCRGYWKEEVMSSGSLKKGLGIVLRLFMMKLRKPIKGAGEAHGFKGHWGK